MGLDQRFSFHELAALAEDMTRAPIGADRVLIDPFDPLRDWKVSYDTEHGHAGRAFDRLRAFAAPHQARCWLVALPVPMVNFGPTEGMRQLLEKQAREEGHIVRMGRTSAQEAMDASGPAMPAMPPLSQWMRHERSRLPQRGRPERSRDPVRCRRRSQGNLLGGG